MIPSEAAQPLIELYLAVRSVPAQWQREFAEQLRAEAAVSLDRVADVDAYTGLAWSAVLWSRLAAVLDTAAAIGDSDESP